MTDTFTTCPAWTTLSDSEIAQIIRSVAADGVALNLYAVGTQAECQLERGHGGDLCGGWIATADPDETRTCWLHWRGERRTVTWLANCPNGCLLFDGHPGECRPIADEAKPEPSAGITA